MESVLNILFILVISTKVFGQLEPLDGPVWTEHCNIRPYMYRQCCILPPFFNRDVARDCGAQFVVNFQNRANITGLQRLSELGCQYWECMLTKYDLKSDKDEGKLDIAKYYEHLNSWVELNPDFNNVMLKAKINCKQNFMMSMPIPVCEFRDFNTCHRNFINVSAAELTKRTKCSKRSAFDSIVKRIKLAIIMLFCVATSAADCTSDLKGDFFVKTTDYLELMNCPNVIQTPECLEVKKFYEDCHEFYE